MKRVDLKCGFSCNNNCKFCVVAHERKLGTRTTEEIKNCLKESKKTCDEVVFTGGEVTIRKDILEIVSYAKELKYKVIQIQTNGRMFCYEDFCKKMIKAGANVFALALHGHNSKIHDKLTNAKGAFNQVVKGIKNLKKLNQNVITNTVVVKENYKNLPELAKIFIELKVDQFQFAFVHALGNAEKNFNEIVPNISEAAKYIKKGVNIGKNSGIPAMIEGIPYCLLEGYQESISENVMPDTEINAISYGKVDFSKQGRLEAKMKFDFCKECKYDNICEGPWKQYPERKGISEFHPIKK
ncbi:MAG: radical SAM protein [Nanoarchaeota archaeon]|nr:radical SAM protein [Nanoarchaeota archaeon]